MLLLPQNHTLDCLCAWKKTIDVSFFTMFGSSCVFLSKPHHRRYILIILTSNKQVIIQASSARTTIAVEEEIEDTMNDMAGTETMIIHIEMAEVEWIIDLHHHRVDKIYNKK